MCLRNVYKDGAGPITLHVESGIMTPQDGHMILDINQQIAPSGMGQIRDGVLRGSHHIGFEQTHPSS